MTTSGFAEYNADELEHLVEKGGDSFYFKPSQITNVVTAVSIQVPRITSDFLLVRWPHWSTIILYQISNKININFEKNVVSSLCLTQTELVSYSCSRCQDISKVSRPTSRSRQAELIGFCYSHSSCRPPLQFLRC